MSTKLIYGKYVVIDADTVIPSGALYVEETRIVDYGSYGEMTQKYRPDRTLGSAETIVIPGLIDPGGYAAEFAAVLQAYGRCGVRVAFAPGLSTENHFIYGDDGEFIETLPSELREFCERILEGSAAFGEKEHFDSVRRLREAIPPDYRERFDSGNRLMRQLRRAVADHFLPWYEEIENRETKPYYLMNNRI